MFWSSQRTIRNSSNKVVLFQKNKGHPVQQKNRNLQGENPSVKLQNLKD